MSRQAGRAGVMVDGRWRADVYMRATGTWCGTSPAVIRPTSRPAAYRHVGEGSEHQAHEDRTSHQDRFPDASWSPARRAPETRPRRHRPIPLLPVQLPTKKNAHQRTHGCGAIDGRANRAVAKRHDHFAGRRLQQISGAAPEVVTEQYPHNG